MSMSALLTALAHYDIFCTKVLAKRVLKHYKISWCDTLFARPCLTCATEVFHMWQPASWRWAVQVVWALGIATGCFSGLMAVVLGMAWAGALLCLMLDGSQGGCGAASIL